jgi:hypothetical protein
MKRKDMDDARWITDEIERKRVDANRPVCAEGFELIEMLEPGEWVHANEEAVIRKHAVVPVL